MVIAGKPVIFTVTIVHCTSQLLHCYVERVSGLYPFYCTFIYASNECSKRISLWSDLRNFRTHLPWIMFEDCNCVRSVE